MSNPVFMDVVLVGDKNEVRSLYGKMKRLQERKKPLVENDFHFPERWLGNLVARLGGDCDEVYCRGSWSSLRLKGNRMSFSTETAWRPPFALLRLVQRRYPSLQFYFEAEGDDWDWYLTNDAEGRFFPSRYIVDCEPDMEYFSTIEGAAAYLSAGIRQPVSPSWAALYAAAEDWNDGHPDAPWPVAVKQIEVIGNEELWE